MGKRIALALVGLVLGASPCWAQVQDVLPPALGGLPADAPARPTHQYDYPAVHDMPPPRPVKPLSDTEMIKLQQELQALREKQKQEAAQAQAPVAPDIAPPTGNPRKP